MERGSGPAIGVRVSQIPEVTAMIALSMRVPPSLNMPKRYLVLQHDRARVRRTKILNLKVADV